MRISFKDIKPSDVLEQIREKLDGRKLGDMVHFELRGTDLEVTIKKMGTSTLTFKNVGKGDHIEWELTSEKIALAHKAFKGDVMEKITKVVTQVGGKVMG